MPTSRPTYLTLLCNGVMKLQPKSILDIGVGFGSKGMLFREYTDIWQGNYFKWQTRIDGVEIFKDYITDLQKSIYDNIYIGDIREVIDTLDSYDFIYMGDIIEHLSREDGLELIKKLMDKSKVLVIATPAKVGEQGSVYGNENERHISQWVPEDFKSLGFNTAIIENVLIASMQKEFNEDIVIMAVTPDCSAGDTVWSLNGVKNRQMTEVAGEPILKRTIRLLKERGYNNIKVTVREKGIFGDLGVEEIVGTDFTQQGRFLNFKDFKERVLFLYGDVYYTENAMDTILSDKNEWRFFGRNGDSVCGGKWSEPFGFKMNKDVWEKLKKFKKTEAKIVQEYQFYNTLNGYPVGELKHGENFTDINDWTDDFDRPTDMWLADRYGVQVPRRVGVYYCEGMKFYGERMQELFCLGDYNGGDTLFIGLYFQADYDVLCKTQGRKFIFWNGSDVGRLLQNELWQETLKGMDIKHACHNSQLQSELLSVGIESVVAPIFFGFLPCYKDCYKPGKDVYINAHPEREVEYGVDTMLKVAEKLPDYTFNVFGVDGEDRDNVVYHGWMDEDIADEFMCEYQIFLRLNEHDGLSQQMIKAGFWGQHILSVKDIPGTIKVKSVDDIVKGIKSVGDKSNKDFAKEFGDKLNNFEWLIK